MKKSLLATVLVAAATMGLAFGADKGKTVQFGRYYEDKAGKKLTPIEWTVLDEKDGRTLLITTKVIDAQPFHNKRIAVTWDNCDLRTWLNGKFFATAFTKEEQAAIATTEVSAFKNPRFDTPVGKPRATRFSF